VDVNGQRYELDGDDVLVQTESRGGLAVASDKGVTVAVDTAITPALLREGYARDLVRAINTMRKDAGLDISDRIDLTYVAGGEVAAAFAEFADYIRQETLALSMETGTAADATFSTAVEVGGDEVMLALRKRE
jgi:isoleucyl-tRNA synthetase